MLLSRNQFDNICESIIIFTYIKQQRADLSSVGEERSIFHITLVANSRGTEPGPECSVCEQLCSLLYANLYRYAYSAECEQSTFFIFSVFSSYLHHTICYGQSNI